MTTISYQLIAFIVFASTAMSSAEKIESLCDNPTIHSANRLVNNTYRVYRGDYFWDLIGLPDKVAEAEGPFKIQQEYMAPVTRTSIIMTLVNGTHSGNTFKFDRDKRWEWGTDGKQIAGGKGGWTWSGFPKYGFNCAFNDGHLDDKHWKFPRMIAFQGIRVFYWNTETHDFAPIDDTENGYVGGHYGEKFPGDLTACMAFKVDNRVAKFFVYLFKKNKYCFRPVVGVDGCKEWRDNRELFGCNATKKRADSSGGDGSTGSGVTPSGVSGAVSVTHGGADTSGGASPASHAGSPAGGVTPASGSAKPGAVTSGGQPPASGQPDTATTGTTGPTTAQSNDTLTTILATSGAVVSDKPADASPPASSAVPEEQKKSSGMSSFNGSLAWSQLFLLFFALLFGFIQKS